MEAQVNMVNVPLRGHVLACGDPKVPKGSVTYGSLHLSKTTITLSQTSIFFTSKMNLAFGLSRLICICLDMNYQLN